jgi:2-dehydro-3-deoxyphosphooctonate aldolase (KDO 8-P synthase)
VREIQIGNVRFAEDAPLAIIAGPCVMEGEDFCLRAAETLASMGVPVVFKASYDKANRTSVKSFRGPGLEEGLRILERVRSETGLPVYTDVHTPEQARAVGQVCDGLQIPAFLCRQTDLLVAAGETGKPITIKKGQFVAPWDMGPAVEKVRSTGNEQIALIDRGTTFGYNNLVTDLRAIPIMQRLDVPVFFDATHSVQLPGGQGDRSTGQVEFVPTLSKGAIAAGADGLFMEVHPDPKNAKSDAGCQLSFEQLRQLVGELQELRALIQRQVVHA